MMKVKSKLTFSDAVSKSAKTKVFNVNCQHSPKLTVAKYCNVEKGPRNNVGKLKGYKLYCNKVKKYDAYKKIRIKAILPGAEFNTRIFFNDLTDKELELLCFALGCTKTFNLKLGGFKNEGYGQVEISGNVIMDRKSVDAKLYAENYKNKYKEFSRSITDVEEIMYPYIDGVKK